MEADMQTMSSGNMDEFGVMKIFSDDATNPKFHKFQSEDERHFNRHYGSCPKNGDDTHSVVTTEWNKSGIEFIDQEVTGYFYLPEIESDEGKHECYKYERGGKGSALAIKLRGGKHSGKKDPKTAKCYIFEFQYEGEHENEKNFQKEYPHPTYYKMNVVSKFNLDDNLRKWVGFKAVAINQGNLVRCLSLIDYGSEGRSKEDGPDLNLQNWKVYYDVSDDGKLHERYDISNESDYKGEVRKPWKRHFAAKLTQFRMDRIVGPEARFLSARRVAVSAESIDDIVNAH
jgi:hypothetical protein